MCCSCVDGQSTRCREINQQTTETKDKLVKGRPKDPESLPHFHGDSVALAEEQWHQLAGCLPPLGTAWVKRRGRDHPARSTHCLAALYTSPGLQQSPPKACSTGGTVGRSQHWPLCARNNNVDAWSKRAGADWFQPNMHRNEGMNQWMYYDWKLPCGGTTAVGEAISPQHASTAQPTSQHWLNGVWFCGWALFHFFLGYIKFKVIWISF